MTPAINELSRLNIAFTAHEYQHDPSTQSYGLEAAEKLNQAPHKVFKTLVVEGADGTLGVAVVPVTGELNLKAIAKCLGTKKATMARPNKVERTTGYVLGGVSPIGQKRGLPTFVDQTAEALATILVSGGKRGLDIELSPTDLLKVTSGAYAPLGISK